MSRRTSLYIRYFILFARSVTAPTDRPATVGPARLRRHVLGNGESMEEKRPCGQGPEFINQFPYKSCQRSKSPRKVTGHKWPHDKAPDKAPKRRVSLKRQKYAGSNNETHIRFICLTLVNHVGTYCQALAQAPKDVVLICSACINDLFSFAHLGDGKTLGLLTNVRDDYHHL